MRALPLVALGCGSLIAVDRFAFPICPSCDHHHHGPQAVAAPLLGATAVHAFVDGWGLVAVQVLCAGCTYRRGWGCGGGDSSPQDSGRAGAGGDYRRDAGACAHGACVVRRCRVLYLDRRGCRTLVNARGLGQLSAGYRGWNVPVFGDSGCPDCAGAFAIRLVGTGQNRDRPEPRKFGEIHSSPVLHICLTDALNAAVFAGPEFFSEFAFQDFAGASLGQGLVEKFELSWHLEFREALQREVHQILFCRG